MKILSVGAEMLHTDRRTDKTDDEANSRFSQFRKRRLMKN